MADHRLYVDFGIWGTVRKVAIGIIAMAVMAGLAVWYVPIVRQTSRLQKEIEIKKISLKKQNEKRMALQEEIQAMKTSPEAVEQAAREKLGLVKPNEIIYRFESNQNGK